MHRSSLLVVFGLVLVAAGAEAKLFGLLDSAAEVVEDAVLSAVASVAGVSRASMPHIDLSAGFHRSTVKSSQLRQDPPRGGDPPGGYIHKELCTDTIPRELSIFGLRDVCADLRLQACGAAVDVGVRFDGSDDFIFRQSFNGDSHQVCQTAENLTSALQYACGNDVKLCVSFMRNSQPTLRIGASYITGCPTVTIESCQPPIGVEIPDMELPLDCFTLGAECSDYKTCDHCVENGCGWCSASNKCMSGGPHRPHCETCGDQTGCDCSWNFGTCPIPPAEIDASKQEMQKKQTQLSGLKTKLDNLIEAVTGGKDVQVGDTQYQCHPPGEYRSAAAISTTISVIVGVLTALGAVALGAFVGKKGYADDIFSRIRLPGRSADDGQALTSETTNYVPPSV